MRPPGECPQAGGTAFTHVCPWGSTKVMRTSPGKAQTRVRRQDTPRPQEGQGTQARPSPPGHLPTPRSPGSPDSVADGDTEAQGKKDSSKSFRREGRWLGIGARARAPHTSHTCVQTHPHWPLCECAHTHSCTGTSKQEGPRPSSPPLGTPTSCLPPALDQKIHSSSTLYVKQMGNFYEGWSSGTPMGVVLERLTCCSQFHLIEFYTLFCVCVYRLKPPL